MRRTTFGFLLTILFIGLVLPTFSFAQKTVPPLQAPNSWDEVLALGKKALFFFPNALKAAWQDAMQIWLKIAAFFDRIWDKYVFSKIKSVWKKISGISGKEVEKRKTALPRELEKEKQEMKTETIDSGKSLWQKFKGLFDKE